MTKSRVEYLKILLKFTKRALDEEWEHLFQEQYDRIKKEIKALSGKSDSKLKK